MSARGIPDGGDRAAIRRPHAPPTERHVLALGLAVSAVFLVAAVGTAVATAVGGGSSWAALHLALAGAALVAIGTFMPHFAVTLAGTRPAPTGERLVAIALLGMGAVLVVGGMVAFGGRVTIVGAVMVGAGIVVTAHHTLAPTRDPLARRHPVAIGSYLFALAELGLSGTIAGLLVLGVPAVVRHWPLLRPAHAWLALPGAVSLTIFATLVYLAPTVFGARIRPGIALVAGLAGIAAGAPITALGFAVDSRPLAVGGAVTAFAGSLGQLAYVLDVVRRRGSFTSEHAWRSVAGWHLTLGPAWFAAGLAIAAVDLAVRRDLAGWSIAPLVIPLVGGWLLQELVGSWTHLVPSVTPGGPEHHASQRRVLAWAGRLRVIGWNAGLALAWAGVGFGIPAATLSGGALAGAALLASVVVLARALAIGRS